GIYGVSLAILPTAPDESAVENKIRGEKYILEAAKLGDLASQRNLGILYSWGGVQIEKDSGKSLEWLAKAARRGDFTAKDNFCRIFLSGMTVSEIVSCNAEPYATSRELFDWLNEVEKGEWNIPPAQAVEFSEDGKRIAPEERAIKKSTANALLSIFYSHGIGTEKDMERAKEFLERSIVSDDMLALFTAFRAINESKNLREYPDDKVIAETERILLLMLYRNKENEMDQDEIVSLLAQFYMALLIKRKDAWAEEMAFTFVSRMNDENPIKCRLLGVCYSDGYGVECDKAKAREYWQRGIEKNDYEAMSLLGISYFNDGDKESALKLLNEAAMHGNDQGKSYLEKIDKLSKEKPRE
ncbi:MAG: sel1 repeat family protein, partial [Porphyromonadaceae bacterium]|nr:sel1 repeat family protein [Porphyromonadaceae bacterium]